MDKLLAVCLLALILGAGGLTMGMYQNLRNMPGGVAGIDENGWIFYDVQPGEQVYFGGGRNPATYLGSAEVVISDNPVDSTDADLTLETINVQGEITGVLIDSHDKSVAFYALSGKYYFLFAGGYATYCDYTTGEQFMRVQRVGANDYRLQIKQGGAWVTK